MIPECVMQSSRPRLWGCINQELGICEIQHLIPDPWKIARLFTSRQQKDAIKT